MRKSFVLGAVLLGGILTSCGGGAGTVTATSVPAKTYTVNVHDIEAGKDFSFDYQTTDQFAPTLMQQSQMSADEQAVFNAINAARAAGGNCYDPATGKTVHNDPVEPLILESSIYKAAQFQADYLIAHNTDTHVNVGDAKNATPAMRMVNNGFKPLPPKAGTGALYFEESLAFGFQTPQEVVNAWAEKDEYKSFDHCMTLYAPLTYGAVAVRTEVQNTTYGYYYVLNIAGNKKS